MEINSIYQHITASKAQHKKMLAVLLDPDQCRGHLLPRIIAALKSTTPDFIFVGGSHTLASADSLIDILKDEVDCRIVLFPGNASQFSTKADALLYLSLISGRNPEYLIGQHMVSALAVKQSGIEVIPTGYVLIDGGKPSSVEYISGTRPIPNHKKEIALSTVIAGELLGLRMMYLEAGSGAISPVPQEMIACVSAEMQVPLIVGGGIKTVEQLSDAFHAGADIVVVGNVFENEPEKINDFITFTQKLNTTLVTPSTFISQKHQDIL